MDCLEYMKTLKDNEFDLIIADPPYGDCDGSWNKSSSRWGGWFLDYRLNGHVGEEEKVEKSKRFNGGTWATKYNRNKGIFWDIKPTEEVFNEMFRVSKNQVIWGGNYFSLPPTRCFIVWDKLSIGENFSMAMCEYAWTSFKKKNAKRWMGVPRGTKKNPRIHPTQKPVGLYEFILKHFAQPGDKILDPFMGSGSSRIACHNMGFDYVGIEIDKDYFDAEEKRYESFIL